jgi:hypothetical protein
MSAISPVRPDGVIALISINRRQAMSKDGVGAQAICILPQRQIATGFCRAVAAKVHG